MEDTLSKALAEIITKTTTGIDKSINFLSGQIPDVVHQALVWNFTYYLILFLLGVGVLGLMIYYNTKQAKWLIREWRKKDSDFFDSPDSMVSMWNMLQVFPLMFVCFTWNLQWLKIWLAPKIWLIEYASKLIK